MNSISAIESAPEVCDSGHLRAADAAALLASVAQACRLLELTVEDDCPDRLGIATGIGTIALRRDSGGIAIYIAARNEGALFMLRETVAAQVEQVAPELIDGLDWTDRPAKGALPPNFRLARVVSVAALGSGFWRLIVRGDGLDMFARDGLHLRLALPARNAAPRWPRLNAKGRVEWPPSDRLHVAVYTVRAVDPAAGTVTIDIFRHPGGRSADWVALARPGETVGLIGPGGGWLPEAAHLVIAGDETALPAIARILESAGPGVTGTALIEVEDTLDYPPFPVPPGVQLRILARNGGTTLESALAEAELGPPGARHIWFAAEKARATAARQELRRVRGVERGESHVTGYWQRH